jgi:hypothetical protein
VFIIIHLILTTVDVIDRVLDPCTCLNTQVTINEKQRPPHILFALPQSPISPVVAHHKRVLTLIVLIPATALEIQVKRVRMVATLLRQRVRTPTLPH